jgi:hypothetical protein
LAKIDQIEDFWRKANVISKNSVIFWSKLLIIIQKQVYIKFYGLSNDAYARKNFKILRGSQNGFRPGTLTGHPKARLIKGLL